MFADRDTNSRDKLAREFAEAIKEKKGQAEVLEVKDRDHDNLFNNIAEDDETAKAIVAFILRQAGTRRPQLSVRQGECSRNGPLAETRFRETCLGRPGSHLERFGIFFSVLIRSLFLAGVASTQAAKNRRGLAAEYIRWYASGVWRRMQETRGEHG